MIDPGWLSTFGFMPHGHCYLWTPALLKVFVLSDSAIALSYASISIALLYGVRRSPHLTFGWMAILFAAFILACGATHLIAIWTIWHPDYWLDAFVKLVTAIISVITAGLLWPLIPKFLRLPTTEQLQEAINERDATNRDLSAFSYAVSHDLRAPLRGIDGWSQALLEDHGDQLDADASYVVNRIRAEVGHMNQIIDDLLVLSRITQAELATEHFDLSQLANDVAQRLRLAEPSRNIEFVIQPEMKARGDRRLIEIALENLIGNACKFTGRQAAARIEIGRDRRQEAGAPSRREVFFVRDNGAGFDMSHAKNLFQAFQRLHKPSEFPGTGIGLATVKRVVERHAGSIWAESEAGRGATFYFTLEA